MKEFDLPAPDGPSAEDFAAPPATGSGLGRNPLDADLGPDPVLEQLDDVGRGWVRRPVERRRRGEKRPDSAALRGRSSAHPPERARSVPVSKPPPRKRWATTPSLSEIDLPDAEGLPDRLIGEDERRRVAAMLHLVEGEAAYDRFGFSPEVLRKAFPIFYALYRFYFRVRSEGHEQIPAQGPAVLAGNHGGLLPFDAAMTVTDIAMNTDPPRLARSIVEHWAGTLPWVNVFFARMGQVIGTRENFASLLDDGQLALVYPEGIDGIRKTIAQRYRLQSFRVGFIEQALRAGAPIIPVATVGSDDQMPILYDIKPLARRLGLPVAPITPTFPWLGPIGLLPYPVPYRIVYGEPLNYHERFGPEGADDTRLIRYLANQVRRAVQALLDRART